MMRLFRWFFKKHPVIIKGKILQTTIRPPLQFDDSDEY